MNYSHDKAVQAILSGHRCAKQLKRRLEDPAADEKSVSSYDLAKSIVDCFSNAISNLSDKPKSDGDWFPDLSPRDSCPSHPKMSHSKKRKTSTSSTSTSEIWRNDSPYPIHNDGFIWRKYGQKYIRKSNHQRSYYRCSYSKEHQCEARKHEQKIKDNPPVYRTTYFGHHTCKINHNQDAIFYDQVDDLESARMIRFGKDLDHDNKENHSGGFYVSVKQGEDKETMDQRTFDVDQDCQDLMQDDLSSSPSCSFPFSSSCGSQDSEYDSELLWDNLSWWDAYDQFEFRLP